MCGQTSQVILKLTSSPCSLAAPRPHRAWRCADRIVTGLPRRPHASPFRAVLDFQLLVLVRTFRPPLHYHHSGVWSPRGVGLTGALKTQIRRRSVSISDLRFVYYIPTGRRSRHLPDIDHYVERLQSMLASPRGLAPWPRAPSRAHASWHAWAPWSLRLLRMKHRCTGHDTGGEVAGRGSHLRPTVWTHH